MASAALLFSFSAILFLLLLHAPAPGLTADLLASALDRLLGGRGLMELATRRNMILLCHAILFLILRDAGVLAGAPASRRRSRSPPGEATATAAAVVAQTAAPVPDKPHATRSAVVAPTASSAAPAEPYATRSTVVWRRRPRNRPVVAPMHEHVDVEWAELAATWAAPVLAKGPAAQAATKQIVLAESSPRNDDGLLDRHDRPAVVEPLEHPTAIAEDGESGHRRMVDDDTAREQPTAGMEMEMELADDRTFEEFIESQRKKMRQESLQLLSSAYYYQYQAIATCY